MEVPTNPSITESRHESRSPYPAAPVFQLAFWTLFGALLFLIVRPVHPFPDILLVQLSAASAIGLVLSSLLAHVYGKLRTRDRHRNYAAAALVLSSPILGLVWYEASAWIAAWIDPFDHAPVSLPGGALFAADQMWLFPAVMACWTVPFLAVANRREQQAQRERILRAEALAHEARLRMLRYQLNPHFLFNALNSIGALAAEAPQRVPHMIAELSGFLRYSLLESPNLVVPLRAEIAAAAHYLAVEQVRFEDQLQVEIEVADAAARREVPAFVVLPLIENAVKHGRQASPLPLRIRIIGRVEGRALRIEIANTGFWAEGSAAAGTGTGLRNVRQRLVEHYGERHHRMDIIEEDGWVCVRIRIDELQR